MFNFPVSEHFYKSDHGGLRLFVFDKSQSLPNLKPAIIFFHGAGFSNNKSNPSQFQQHAEYYSSIGVVSICVEYRPSSHVGLFSPIESITHAKSAIRWVRQNAVNLGIDASKVVACGASAGGYLSLCCAMIDSFNDINDDLSIDCIPNALVIFNGGVDSELLIQLFPESALDLVNACPIDNIRAELPPSIFFHGTDDKNIPLESVMEFVENMVMHGNTCKIDIFEGMEHGFFNYGNHGNVPYLKTIEQTKKFLEDQNILG